MDTVSDQGARAEQRVDAHTCIEKERVQEEHRRVCCRAGGCTGLFVVEDDSSVWQGDGRHCGRRSRCNAVQVVWRILSGAR